MLVYDKCIILNSIKETIDRFKYAPSAASCLILKQRLVDNGLAMSADNIVAAYRRHSKARALLGGFEDIDDTVWADMTVTERAVIRIERLEAFYISIVK